MNKQIEEMAKDLRKSEHWQFDEHSVDFELDRKRTAENLCNAGYRKASDVAREIFAEIDRKCIDIHGEFNFYRFAELKKKYESEGEG